MKVYFNKNTDCLLKESVYKAMLVREYTEQWNEEYPNLTVLDFKEEGGTLKDYINYMQKHDIDTDFEIFETSIYDSMTFAEASEKWGLADSTLRKLVTTDKLKEGIDFRKSGKVWLITKEAMQRIYGEPKTI